MLELERPDVSESNLAAVKENFNRATGMLLDLLMKLMSGDFLEDTKSLATANLTFVNALEAASNETEDGEKETLSLVKQFRVILTQFQGNAKSVAGVDGSLPAPCLLSTLASSSDQSEEDRARQWKHVQAERKKFVSFSVPSQWTKDGLLAAFRGTGKVFAHKGGLNSSHRLICASADLLKEEEADPWSQASKPDQTIWKEICSFCCSLSGMEDFVMLFDGRMREVRRLNVSYLRSCCF